MATWNVRLDAADADAGGFQMTEQPGGGWTVRTGPNGAAITWAAAAGAGAQNALEIRVEPEVTRFYVNGTEVTSLPSEQVKPYGTAGLRINHALDVAVKSSRWGRGDGAATATPR
jgi:hypothetical protein